MAKMKLELRCRLHSAVRVAAFALFFVALVTSSFAGSLGPLLATNKPVDWWFAFKFNAKSFPACNASAERHCIFGGELGDYGSRFSQQFIFASKDSPSFHAGINCLGDSTDDPVGATFDQVYNGKFSYVIWNDQFYGDPPIKGCTASNGNCGSLWGHSKGMLAWDEDGNGFVMQVTTPSWPASGNKKFPRKMDGNTLGCVTDNDVMVSQHFLALKLNKDDVLTVLKALENASVATNVTKQQVVNSNGPADLDDLVRKLGQKSKSRTPTISDLSSGVKVISKPARLYVPPWQLVSALLGGVDLKVATWWEQSRPKTIIRSTTRETEIDCWPENLSQKSGAVVIAKSGTWNHKPINLTGGLGTDFNHAKFGVSENGEHSYTIFGDMNQEGVISAAKCNRAQNARGGLFFVFDDPGLHKSVSDLLDGEIDPPQ